MGDLDTQLFLWMHAAFSGGGWRAVMALLSVIGSGWGAVVAIPFLVMRRSRRFGAWLVAVFSITALEVFVLKAVVQRPRPYLAVPDVAPLVFEAPTDFSFPSGHAAGSFAFASFVAVVAVRSLNHAWRGYALGAGLMLLAAGVALSRVALGVHYPGDVTAGAVLGSTMGALGAQLYAKHGARRDTELGASTERS
jgi:undecaprenyl-diphosphatase